MKTYYPHRKTLTIWRTLLTIAAFIPAVIIAFTLSGRLYYLVFGGWFFLYLLLFLVYLPLLHNSLRYEISEAVIVVRRGVFYKTEKRIPPINVQFTTLTADPFSKLFRLVSLHIVCAGSRLFFSGLTNADAQEIVQAIENFRPNLPFGEAETLG